MPEEFYGCEVWRGLDWISDDKKVGFDMSNHLDLQKDILDVFESQIADGKSYTEASIGRRYANATHFQSHSVDSYKLVNYGIDMKELLTNKKLSVKAFALSFVDDLKKEKGFRRLGKIFINRWSLPMKNSINQKTLAEDIASAENLKPI